MDFAWTALHNVQHMLVILNESKGHIYLSTANEIELVLKVLATTTTCYTKQNLARFTVDSQDAKPPNLMLGITVYATNPQCAHLRQALAKL